MNKVSDPKIDHLIDEITRLEAKFKALYDSFGEMGDLCSAALEKSNEIANLLKLNQNAKKGVNDALECPCGQVDRKEDDG